MEAVRIDRIRAGQIVLSLAVVVLVLVSPGWLTAASPKLAPDVVLQSADGVPVPLATYKGKVLLVDFWASWCVPCKTSFPALDAIYREYQPRGLEVLAVNLDEERKNADAFLTDRPHRMTVLFDPKGASPVAFGVKGMPSSFLIDKTGAIRFTHMGYSDNVDLSTGRRSPNCSRSDDVITLIHLRTLALVVLAAVAALAAGGCATVQPWQRGRLADRCMMFDPNASQVEYMTHWQEAREGSSGGYGVQSGGCGCK